MSQAAEGRPGGATTASPTSATAGAPPPVRVEVLGPLRLLVDGSAVDVAGPKRRAVLALLALAEGRTVTVDLLVDALWPSGAPESGRQAVHTHVSRLRGHLGPAAARLQTTRDGYRLELAGDDLDITQARSLLGRARREPAGALAALRAAHALWRGRMLADLLDVEPVATAVAGCAQLHREVTDALVGCAIEAGQAERVAALAAESLADDPLREPAVLLQMRALAATGRAAEALRTGREYRHRLADETGLDPSPALGALERDIAGGVIAPVPEPAPAARRTPAARPTSRLIGRAEQVAALHRLLSAERLVTVVGPGGVGKTRVALEVARQAGPSVPVLLLAPVTEAAAIPHALAAALNLTVVQGDVLAACVALLTDRPGLLVIDNCEHLLDAVRETVGVLLAGCPELAVLTTSREPLGLAAEYTSRLPPLPLPAADRNGTAPASGLEQVPSVAVFLDRAARVRPGLRPTPADLGLIADLVRRLDGMPLAIELAAGRLSTFALADLHGRLDRALDLLGTGRSQPDMRHRTLRATVEWSYQLLTVDERRLFRYLSVFVAGVDLATAEELAAELNPEADPGSVLARLVDASMIEAVFEGGTRYRMLETMRAFGLDRLAAEGEAMDADARMLRWGVELMVGVAAALMTAREPEADARLRRELPNLRRVWRLARRPGNLDSAVALMATSASWDMIGYRDLTEMRGWAEELGEDPALPDHPRAATVIGVAAEAAYQRGDYPRSERMARAGLQRAVDREGRWACLTSLSVAELARGAYPDVIVHSLAAAENADLPRENLGIAALAAAYQGDLEYARELGERSLASATWPSVRGFGLYVLAEIDSAAGRWADAEDRYERAIALARGAGATFIVAVATVGLQSVRANSGRVTEALRGYREVVDYFAGTGNWTHLWTTLRNLAELLRRLDDHEPAAVLDAAADRAPDAPAAGPSAAGESAPTSVPPVVRTSRAEVLATARRAIERHLGGSDTATGREPAPLR